MKKKLIIIGTSTTAESVYKFIKKHNLFNIIGFAVDRDHRKIDSFNNLPVYDIEDIGERIDFDIKKDLLFVAIQWSYLNKVRRDVYEKLKLRGFHFANLISPHAIIYGDLLGENCWISDFVILDTDSTIGNNVYVKSKAYIAHYTKVQDHCFIGANSFVAGAVEIGEQSFIGICSTIFDDVKIGKKCLIGACTIVKRSLPDFSIVKTKSDINVIVQSTQDDIENKLIPVKNIR